VKDCSIIRSGSVLASDTVVPPFTVWQGSPAVLCEEMTEAWQEVQRQNTTTNYDGMQLRQQQQPQPGLQSGANKS
jgi:hypothetical protein